MIANSIIHTSFVLKHHHHRNVLFRVFIEYLYTLKHTNDKANDVNVVFY